ncbi:sigma-54 interaction domain-containing protein [Cytobacillus pseudoceanisediminis]|uniref:sigma-54 interaction domain-containing protein n=1 Tax=Cytobacillus pseudoceanisediminis TaxID=3051614 RepID=UPI003C2D728A
MNENLEKEIEFYRKIMELSHSGIAGVDNEGRIILFNQAAADFLKVPVKEAIGKLVTEVNPAAGLSKVLEEKSVQRDQLRKVGQRTAIISRAPIHYKGELIGAISSVRDITELQQYEETFRRKMIHQGLRAKFSLDQIVGTSKRMERLIGLAEKYAAADSTLLVQGESGTGKEMIAQGIHIASRRKGGPFVAVNCAALPESLLESELFGYEEGSFTGARKGGKAGLFEMAHKGTIFLDEIGELPLLLQARLLRVLQEREVMRIGGSKMIPVDVRIIAATNRNLIQLIHEGDFREDLYFRLAVLVLKVPSLRERLEDIPCLVESFLKEWRKAGSIQVTEEDIRRLQTYTWPGNIRELKNLLERALVLTEDGEPLQLFNSDVWISAEHPSRANKDQPSDQNISEEEIEDLRIKRILAEEDGHIGKAASRLGIHRSTLWRKLKNLK